MFEKSLKLKVERIFGIPKVTYSLPSESRDQQAIFIDVKSCYSKLIDARQIAKVEGEMICFANADKFPFGFFTKRISEAEPADTKELFFGPEQNVGVIGNIAERKFTFMFLFDSQYDPSLGTITELTTSYPES
jgi:hypothetical protein